MNRTLTEMCSKAPEFATTGSEGRGHPHSRWFAGHSGWLLILDNVDTTMAADALALVKELNGLALAMEQAGSFIVQTRLH